jgi:hypothetical protein
MNVKALLWEERRNLHNRPVKEIMKNVTDYYIFVFLTRIRFQFSNIFIHFGPPENVLK